MALCIELFADYVCPFCFLAEFPLQAAMAGKDAELKWRPFELRPAPQATLRPEGDYLRRVWNESIYPLAEALGVPIVLPAVSPQPHTHVAFEGFQFADARDQGQPYSHAVMSAYFQHQRDIGSVDVLTDIAASLGLDAEQFRQALQTRRYRDAHQSALNYANYVQGITAVPTFIIGEQKIRGLKSQRFLEETIAAELAKLY